MLQDNRHFSVFLFSSPVDWPQISALEHPTLPDIEQAIHQFSLALQEMATGKLVSFSLTLPRPGGCSLLDTPLGSGEIIWIAPLGKTRLQGTGVAFTVDTSISDLSTSPLSTWVWQGQGKHRPRCFFTTPPATETLRFSLTVPLVLKEDTPHGTTLHFSARQLGQPAKEQADAWRNGLEALYQPAPASSPKILQETLHPEKTEWQHRFHQAVAAIEAGKLRKLVLSRYREITLASPISAARLLMQLRPHYADCHTFTLPHANGSLLAASPEPLLIKEARQLTSHALAGTTRRGNTTAEDQQLAENLANSAKERQEHAIVVESIVARMQRFCTCLQLPAGPTLRKLRFVQHLWTPVHGILTPDKSFFSAIAELHPTPAVLGEPADAARACLNALGETRDGQYTGLAGWIDPAGDGEAVVILRSAYLHDRHARLWAGAGIMENSNADAEAEEIDLKMATLLEVFRP